MFAGGNAPAEYVGNTELERFAHKKILFVGVDWERKGGPVLLEAFRRVRRTHPTAELIIVGCSPEVSLAGCRVVGRVPLEDVANFYRSASVFCLPTTVEPFGFVFLEAFSHGLPIVATNIGAIPDFVQNGRSGYLVDSNDVEQLANRLGELLGDPDRCATFGARGRALASDLQHFGRYYLEQQPGPPAGVARRSSSKYWLVFAQERLSHGGRVRALTQIAP